MVKDKRIALRLDEETYAMLELLAEGMNVNKSKAIRIMIKKLFSETN